MSVQTLVLCKKSSANNSKQLGFEKNGSADSPCWQIWHCFCKSKLIEQQSYKPGVGNLFRTVDRFQPGIIFTDLPSI